MLEVIENPGADLSWEVQSPKDGAIHAAFVMERDARRYVVLIENATQGAREVPNDSKAGRSFRRGRSAPKGPNGPLYRDGPKPGKVYDVLTGEEVESVSNPTAVSTEPDGPGRQTPPDEDEPEAWDGPDGCEVTAWPSGLVYVRFPRRPVDTVLAELRGAGFRWMGRRKAWRGLREDLPASFAC